MVAAAVATLSPCAASPTAVPSVGPEQGDQITPSRAPSANWPPNPDGCSRSSSTCPLLATGVAMVANPALKRRNEENRSHACQHGRDHET